MDIKSIEVIYPASPFQEALLAHIAGVQTDSKAGGLLICTLQGGLDVARFEESWNLIASRQPTLRTSFAWKLVAKPVQVVHWKPNLSVEREDWRRLPSSRQEELLKEYVDSEMRRPVNPAEAGAVRLYLCQTANDVQKFICSYSRLLLDERSARLLLGKVLDCYDRLCGGQDSQPEQIASYRDYIAWLAEQEPSETENFWKTALNGFSSATSLKRALFHGGHEGPAGECGKRQIELSPSLIARLRPMMAEHGLTMTTLLEGAWALLLSRYSGEQKVVFGVTLSVRSAARGASETMLGPLTNTLPALVNIGDEEATLSWLKDLQTQQASIRRRAHSSVDQIRDWINLPGDFTLFESRLILDADSVGAFFQRQFGSLSVSDLESIDQPGSPLSVEWLPVSEPTIQLTYRRHDFNDTTIERMLRHLETILETIGANPRANVGELPLLSHAERQEILVTWNGTARSYPQDRTIHELFEAQAQQTPDRVAIVCPGQELSYQELDRRANQLANYLRRIGVGPEVVVGLCLERSVELVIGLLGALKAGGSYLPLDPSYPPDRLSYLMRDMEVKVALTRQDLAWRMPEFQGRIVCLDEDSAKIDQENNHKPQGEVSPWNLSYVIYTSGSTGDQKGVTVHHRALVARAVALAETFELTSADRLLQFVSPSFDAFAEEVFPILSRGSCLVIDRDVIHYAPRDFFEMIERLSITILHILPAYWHQLVNDLSTDQERALSQLRLFISGGESPSVEALRKLSDRTPQQTRFVNAYGPTETTITSAIYSMQMGSSRTSLQTGVPIGKPIANTQIYVLDRARGIAPVGVKGEIYIGGEGVARGYWRHPDLTAERFTPDPFGASGDRLYRTGDWGDYRADGNIEHLGRMDRQVKIRGHRIELGEIESVLNNHRSVRQSAVIVSENGSGSRQLLGHVVADNGTAAAELRRYLKERLPEYMVPAKIMILESMPLTPNGKVDLKRLTTAPSLKNAGGRMEEEYASPRTPAEKTLVEIFQELLKLDQVGIHDNFFELGGDSILSIQIIARANEAGLGLTPKQLFQRQTIAELAAVANPEGMIEVEGGRVIGEVPLTPIQAWFFEGDYEAPEHFNQAVMLEAREELDFAAFSEVIKQLDEQHDVLRHRFRKTESGWLQICEEHNGTVALENIDLSGIAEGAESVMIEEVAAEYQKRMDLGEGPLMRVLVFGGNGRRQRLLFIAHHLLIDGVSWRILLSDIERGYEQARRGEPIKLGVKTTSYKRWAELLKEKAQSAPVREKANFWLAGDGKSMNRLPTDKDGANTVASGKHVFVSLNEEETAGLLREVPKAYKTQIQEVLLAAVARGVGEWAGLQTVSVDVEGHGREEIAEDVDLTRTVGWFTTIYPLKVEVESKNDLELLRSAKERIREVSGHGICYGMLKYLSDDPDLRERLQVSGSEIAFNYLGQLDLVLKEESLFGEAKESPGRTQSQQGKRRYLIEINGHISGGRLRFAWTYSENLHRRETIEAVAERTMEALRGMIAGSRSTDQQAYTPSDFPLAQVDQRWLDQFARVNKEIEDIYALSPLQKAMLIQHISGLNSQALFLQLTCNIRGKVDLSAFKKAWRRMVERHPILRTSFEWEGLDEPVQVVHRRMEIPIDYLDWGAITRGEQDRRLEVLAEADRWRGVDLSNPPLMRMSLIRLEDDLYRLVWSYHHILGDGWSTPLIMQEVTAGYEAYRRGEEPVLEAAPPYREYIAWLKRQDMRKAQAHWRERLKGFNQPTKLWIDRGSGTPANEGAYEEQQAVMGKDATERLEVFARQHRLTINTILQAAFGLLLSKYSGTNDVIFGATVSGRPVDLPGSHSIIGPFINTLPVRMKIPYQSSLLPWLSEIQREQVEDGEHTYISLVEQYSVIPLGIPLYESILVFESYPNVQAPTPQSRADHAPAPPNRERRLGIDNVQSRVRTKYPLTVVSGPGSELGLLIAYDSRRFDVGDISRMLGHFRTIIEGITNNPERPIWALSSLPQAEQDQLLAGWKSGQRIDSDDLCVHQIFDAQAEKTPDAIAVVFGQEQMSYRELNRRANQLAVHLHARGVRPEMGVGVYLEPSPALLVGALGIMKAGGAVVTLESADIADHAASMLLTEQSLIERRLDVKAEIIRLDADWTTIDGQNGTNPDAGVSGENLAFIIYTSGSTGKPKRVMITHQGLRNQLLGRQDAFGLNEEDRALANHSLYPDVSTLELLWPLLAGARLVIAPQEAGQSRRWLLNLLAWQKITTAGFTPSVFTLLLREEGFGKCDSLRRVILSGETFRRQVQIHTSARTGLELHDLYSMAETSGAVMTQDCSPRPDGEIAPVGSPLADNHVYLLDSNLQPVPARVAGQVSISGSGMARGYCDRADLTAESFIPDPFSEGPGERMFRSKDIARHLPDGKIEVLTRADHQIKLQFSSIEPSAIESALMEYPGIDQAAFLLVGDAVGDARLTAYLAFNTDIAPSAEALRLFLRERFPAQMIPSAFLMMKALPLTINDRIDRKALAMMKPGAVDSGMTLTGGGTPYEEMLSAIWADLFGVKEVSGEDNFFDLGGHSLLATQMMSRVREVFSVEIPLRDVFEEPTIRGLAGRIAETLRAGEKEKAPPLVRVSREGRLPLSFAQQRMWFLAQLVPDNPFYNCPFSARLEGSLDLKALEEAINGIVRRHETLRTRIEVKNNEPEQVIEQWEHRRLEVEDLTNLSEKEREAEVERIAREDAEQAFDLSEGPLIRVKVLKLGEKDHVVLFMMHHIVCDGWSKRIILNEVEILYRAYIAGEPSPLKELEIQYADYAVWQRNWLQGDALERQLIYWRARLEGMEPLKMPTDHPRPAVAAYRGANLYFAFSREVTHGFRALSRRGGATLFMTLLAAFKALFMRYSGQTDIVVGTTIANRRRAETEELIGFFVNTLVLRTHVEERIGFRDLLGRVREVCLGAYAQQDLPFEQLVEHLQPERDLSRQPLFQVALTLHNAPTAGKLESSAPLRMSAFEVPSTTSIFDLMLQTEESEDQLRCHVNYNNDLFEAATIERLIRHLNVLSEAVVTNPDQPISEIEYLTTVERRQLLVEWNQTRKEYGKTRFAHEIIAEQARLSGDAIAVRSEQGEMTYAELDRVANQFAHHLRALGVGPGAVVGLFLERSLEMVVGLLGALKAGGAYLPLDPEYPKDRLAWMIEDADVSAVLTQRYLLDRLPASDAQIVCFDREWDQIASRSIEAPALQVSADNLAYVIFTSGSTGRPKGAAVYHRGMANLLHWFITDFNISAGDSVLLISSPNFDLTQKNFFAPLMVGATLCLYHHHYDPVIIRRAIREHGATLLNCTPSAFYPLVEEIEESVLGNLKSLRLVFLGGEPIAITRLRPWLSSAGCRAQLVNTYGPTECADICAYYRIEEPDRFLNRAVPIGRPIYNTELFILGSDLEPAPIGVVGELCIQGEGVGAGYLNNSELTAEKFVASPYSDVPKLLYRTGDAGKYLPDGNIEFIGRADHQVKIRGYRIELGEIENALMRHPAVGAAAVIVREDISSDKRIVAYVVRDGKYIRPGQVTADSESIARRISQWETVFDQTYHSPIFAQDPEFNAAGWNSSYTGEPISDEEMREWLDDTVNRILSLHPESVLEIGCGTGLVLFRVAPHCRRYCGTDISQQALAQLDNLFKTRQELSQVTLLHRSAENFDGIEPESFDTIILNSVVQYFPNVDYLTEVLEKAVRSVKSGGAIVIGDVRSLPLLKAFHASVQLRRAPSSLSTAELKARIQRRLGEEKELVIDPRYFIALKRLSPRIKHVEIRLKGGRRHNELTKYRYEATLHISDDVIPPVKCSWVDWHSNSLNLPAIENILSANGIDMLAVKRAPNARLVADDILLDALASGDAADNVGDLHLMLRSARKAGIEPDDLTELGRNLNYKVSILWSESGDNCCFDAVFLRQDVMSDRVIQPAINPLLIELAASEGSNNKYANDPLTTESSASLITELREYVRQRLPEYMAPSTFMVMDELPLTPSGKVNRRALPFPGENRSESSEEFASPRTPVEEMLLGIFEAVLKLDRVSVNDNFFEIGGHSLRATQVVSRAMNTFGVGIAVKDLFEEPTVEGFARKIEETMRTGRREQETPLVRAERVDNGDVRLPLSFAQQRLWFLDQLVPNSPLYNCPGAVKLEGSLDIEALESAIDEIVRRHEVLRTRFEVEGGEPVQVIDQWEPRRLEQVDLRSLVREEREEKARRIMGDEATTAFDLGRGPLFRVKILKLGDEDHLILFTTHHIVSDQWSMGILIREVSTLYGAYTNGEESPLPELPIQYSDFAVWQREWLKGEALEQRMEYWRERLKDLPTLELPTDYARPAIQSFRGKHCQCWIDSDQSRRLRELCRIEGVTPFMALLATFQTLLGRYSGQQDVAVGTVIANRNRLETEGLIGFFVNQLVMRADLSGEQSFRDLLKKVRRTALEAYANQDLPFEMLVEELAPERNLGRSPLCQVVFALQNAAEGRGQSQGNMELQKLLRESIESGSDTAKYDLTVIMTETTGGLEGVWEYCRDLFEEETIRKMIGHFQTLLRSAVTNPESRLYELEVLTEAEREQMLVEWNATEVEYPKEKLIHELFQWQAEKIPQAIALAYEDQSVSYGELNARANRLAHHLQGLGVGPEARVAICLKRGVEMVVAMLATLKAGAAYVPLDPAYPSERLAYMLEDSAPLVVLIHGASRTALPAHASGVRAVDLDADAPQWADYSEANPDRAGVGLNARRLAYVLYTSGSTGLPKGVAIEHKSVVNFICWAKSAFHVNDLERTLFSTSINFDLAVYECFVPLAAGTTIAIVGNALDLERSQAEVTLVNTVPSAIKSLLDTNGVPKSVRALNLAGEPLRKELVEDIFAATEVETVCNLYGPSETTTYSTWVEMKKGKGFERHVGKPIANTQIYILDDRLEPSLVGVSGEIHIGGAGESRGYVNRPEMTAERFLPDPFGGEAGRRVYKTGDLGRWLSEGKIEFLGRNDSQVKIRGYRIELGEIEARLSRHPEVREAVVVASEERDGNKKLVAYYTGAELEDEELRSYLISALPDYMTPAVYVYLEALPLTPNGKLDRRALPAPDMRKMEERNGYLAPRTAVEEIVIGIFEEVLKLDRVGRNDNFFDLGGHSLLATKVISRVRKMSAVEIGVRSIFEKPTAEGLAGRIEEALRAGKKDDAPPLVRVSREQRLPLSFAQQRLWFIDRFESGSALYNIPGAMRLEGGLDVVALERSVNEIARRHEVLRTRIVVESGEPAQVIDAWEPQSLDVIDLTSLSQEEKKEEVSRRAREEAETGFDLSRGPLLRVKVLKLGEDDYLLLYTMHHIVSDGWSMEILIREVEMLYRAYGADEESPLPELEIQYADFAVWQRAYLAGGVLETEVGYWREQLKDAAVLRLPTDRPRPPEPSYRGRRRMAGLGQRLSEELKTLSRREGATLFMTLMAAFKVLLMKYSGQEDISVGTVIANRTRKEVEGLIGFFVNTLVMRTDLSGNPSFSEFMKREREVALGAYTHQEVPFEKLVEELNPERDLSQSPLFQVVLTLQNARRETGKPKSAPPDDIRGGMGSTDEEQFAHFDLTLTATDLEGGLEVAVEYSLDLFDAGTIERMIGHYMNVLDGVVKDGARPIWSLDLLSKEERKQVVEEWNATEADYLKEKLIHELFEEQAERSPHAVALVYEEHSLTYGELNARANRLAHHLQGLGVGPEARVAICLERGLEMVVAMMATLKAGGAYAPLDPNYPSERLAYMLEDGAPVVLLTHGAVKSALGERLPAIPTLDLESDEAQWIGQSDQNPGRLAAASDARSLAYVIYTSGSTGAPKGVMVGHANVVRLMDATDRWFGFGPDDVWTLFHSYAFDFSVWELWGALAYGGRLIIVPQAVARSPEEFHDLLCRAEVTVLNQTPSAFRQLISVGNGKSELHNLRWVIFGGEALDVSSLRPWYERSEDQTAQLVNMYGITETTVHVTYRPLEESDTRRRGASPIGRRIPDLKSYILDAHGLPAPIGVTGELHVGGAGVARGYLNRPELTAERFQPDGNGGEAGERVYKTGDLGRWLPEGEIEFVGRNDSQVKMRGYRIELGEIEAVLTRHPGVQEAIVMPKEYAAEDNRLVAYLVPDQEHAFTVRQMLRFERQGSLVSKYELPNNMAIVHINKGETDFMYKEIFEERTYARHGVTLNEGDCVFDVGANIGLFTLFAGLERRDTVIYAFEPIPPVFDALRMNAELYGLNVKLFNFGLSDAPKSEIVTYYPNISVVSGLYADDLEQREVIKSYLLNQGRSGAHEALASNSGLLEELLEERLASERIDCQFKTISDVILENNVERIDLLKIDVERSELDVLSGIREEDWKKIRQCVVEVHDIDGRLEEITSLFNSNGYVVTVEQDALLKDTGLYNVYAVKIEEGESGSGAARIGPIEAPRPAWRSERALVSDVREYLRSKLPDYMAPAAIVTLEAFPLTPNGKLDRRRLPAPEGEAYVRRGYEAPEGEVERKLAKIWADVLKLGRVGRHDNFFELGGHSLLVINVIERMRSEGMHADVRTLFITPTLAEMAAGVGKVKEIIL